MNREYSNLLDKAVSYVKQLKASNDLLNKAIGVESTIIIANKLRIQQPIIEENMEKTEELIQKLQKSYLDPDTARKIGTIKQQFRIQRDRRKQLISSGDFADKKSNNQRINHRQESYTSFTIETNKKQENSTWNRLIGKESQSTRTDRGSIQLQKEQQGFDHQVESKILRQKHKQIQHISTRLMNVHNIMNETGQLVHEQGEKIDIIGDQIFQSYRNVNDARENLGQANEQQKKARRKYVYFSLTILLLVAAIIAIFVIV